MPVDDDPLRHVGQCPMVPLYLPKDSGKQNSLTIIAGTQEVDIRINAIWFGLTPQVYPHSSEQLGYGFPTIT